jgi:imidazoleglycerol-phosphate dehydratase / histidinol-phosphatase
MNNILFVDRDGTLVEEPDDNQVDDLAKIRLCFGVIPSLLKLIEAGFQLVMVSNQNGVGSAQFPEVRFKQSHDFILDLFATQGITFCKIFICPHLAEAHCACRKPKTGLLDAFLKENTINYERSWVIGDRDTDRILAERIGVSFISKEHDWHEVTQEILLRLNTNS